MCNHYANHPDAQALLQTWREYISWSLTPQIAPPSTKLDEEIWPRREAAVVRQSAEAGGAFVDIMTWGVPLTMPGKRSGTKVTKHITNVRNLNSPFWRSMLAKPEQRCLVPFTRFAEPVIGGGKAEHWFTIKDRSVAAFAGVWRWAAEAAPAVKPAASDDLFGNLDDAGEGAASEAHSPAKVFAFLTCDPNPLVAPLHPKAMPVILDESDYERWLTGTGEEACKLAVPFASQLMGVE